MQQRWVSKLLGYDSIVKFMKRSDNKTIDALSRMKEEEIEDKHTLFTLISVPTLDLLNQIRECYKIDLVTQQLCEKMAIGEIPNILWKKVVCITRANPISK